MLADSDLNFHKKLMSFEYSRLYFHYSKFSHEICKNIVPQNFACYYILNSKNLISYSGYNLRGAISANHQISLLEVIFATVKFANHSMPEHFIRLPFIDISIISTGSNTCTFTVEWVTREYHIYKVYGLCNRRSAGLSP